MAHEDFRVLQLAHRGAEIEVRSLTEQVARLEAENRALLTGRATPYTQLTTRQSALFDRSSTISDRSLSATPVTPYRASTVPSRLTTSMIVKSEQPVSAGYASASGPSSTS